jgi:hypothetical protein
MIGKYNPVDFTNIKRVELVGFDNPSFIKWKERTYKPKLTESQKKRKKKIEKFPEEIEILRSIYLNRTCYYCKRLYSGGRCYGNRELKYIIPSKIDAKKCKYFKLKMGCIHYKEKFGIMNLNIQDSNVDYYLFEIGLTEKLEHKTIGQDAKEKEFQFLNKIKTIEEINVLEKKIFKIYYDNRITFKIPDAIFSDKENKYSIVEYKINEYEGDEQQILDYEKLFIIATRQKDIKLLWIIHEISSLEWTDFFKRNKMEKQINGITLLTEEEFFNNFTSMQTGLAAWM